MKKINFKHIGIIYSILISIPIIIIIFAMYQQLKITETSYKQIAIIKNINDQFVNINTEFQKMLFPLNNFLMGREQNIIKYKKEKKKISNMIDSLKSSVEQVENRNDMIFLFSSIDSVDNMYANILKYGDIIINNKQKNDNKNVETLNMINRYVNEHSVFFNNVKKQLKLIEGNTKSNRDKRIIITKIVILIVIFISVVLLFTVMILSYTFFNKYINELSDVFKAVGEQKQLNKKMKPHKISELDNISKIINKHLDNFKSIFNVFKLHSDGIAGFSYELSVSSEEISAATEEIASSMENINGEAGSLKNASNSLNNMINELNTLMEKTQVFIEDSKNVNKKTIELMESETDIIYSSNDNLENMDNSLKNVQLFINDFNSQVNTIQASVESIKKIHKKIELLSLNAAIEAARAGKDGGGFAVIAEEIRSLSSKSAEASNDIEKIMSEVISNIKQLYALINDSTKGFDEIHNKWSNVSNIASEINDVSKTSLDKTSTLEQHIKKLKEFFEVSNKKIIEIGQKINSIANSSDQMSSSNEQITSQIQELTASSQELADKAREMTEQINEYKI